MSNNKKFVVKNGLTANNISFVDSIGNPLSSINVVMSDTGTLLFEGSSGQLFSITDSMTGTIFSVNDISGIPSIDVDADGTIRLAEASGNVLIGTTTDNGTDRLQVNGDISATNFKGDGSNLTNVDAATLNGKTASAFSITTHTHAISDITGAGNIASINTNGSTTNYLRGDGTWGTPATTAYAEITTAEIDAGTAATLRTITGRRLKYALDKKADAVHGHSVSDITGLSDAATTSVAAIQAGTTAADVGLGNVLNVASYSKTEADTNFLGKTAKADDSDKLDGKHASAFSLTGHSHNASDITGLSDAATTSVASIRAGTTAANVGLGNVLNVASYSKTETDANFLGKTAKAADSDKLDGKHASEFANAAHTHTWTEVTSKPTTATRWPTFSEVTGKPATYPPSSHTHDVLQAVDDRDVKPNTTGISGDNAIKAYFTSLGGLNGSANTDYQDFLVLDTYMNSSGGSPNALSFDKSADRIRHFRPAYDAATWGPGRDLAYLDEVLGKTAKAADSDKLDGKQLSTIEQEYAAADAATLTSAKSYADGVGTTTLASANSYTDTAVSNLVAAAPGTLDTLNELAAALGDDPNFATTISNELGSKLNSSAYTAADVLTKIKTVDGSGSGLDADLLDGKHASAFALASHTHSVSNITGLSDAATTSVAAIRSGTTAANVGLGSVRNVASYSQTESNARYVTLSTTQTISGSKTLTGTTKFGSGLGGGVPSESAIVSGFVGTDGADNIHLHLQGVNNTAVSSEGGGAFLQFATSTSAGYGAQIGGRRRAGGGADFVVKTGLSADPTDSLVVDNNGDITASKGKFVGNGSGLTNVNAEKFGGRLPSSFANASHNHTLSNITDAGNLAGLSTNGSTANYLRGDGSWVTPPNTTYSVISTAEIDAGTASTARTINAARIKYILDKKANVSHTHTLANITNAGDLAAINKNGSTANYLRGDGSWVTPPNTTYAEISTAEIDAGTASTLRTITGRRMKHALDKKANVSHTHDTSHITSGVFAYARIPTIRYGDTDFADQSLKVTSNVRHSVVRTGGAVDDGTNSLQVQGGARTDTLAAGNVQSPQESIDTDGNIQVRNEGQLKMGDFAIQYNAATKSLDFNWIGV